jgi:S-methylmethionine-dependent homocysteine/selenocysteine methylase
MVLSYAPKAIFLLWRGEAILSAGAFVPEVVLENPEVVTQLHREFIRAGSDVVQAFTLLWSP